MIHIKKIMVVLSVLVVLMSCGDSTSSQKVEISDHEIIYHVFQRSFYDSNGDQIGDLKGLTEKLSYLQDLGVTSILLVPVFESIYYHNYFSSDFEKLDSTLGTKQDYFDLIKAVHQRGMKIYMDMETQYVSAGHKWFLDAYKKPSSLFSDYIAWDDSAHTIPSSIVYDLRSFTGYNGDSAVLTTVNMNSEKVKEYNFELFKYWMDPNGDGNFSDGVDGFRLDHMMDDLDNKGRWTHLFNNFWKPMITQLKQINPKIIFMAEQANWGSLGLEYLKNSGVDRVFAFRLAFEIRNFSKSGIEKMADSSLNYNPGNTGQIIFLENHDMPRFSSIVGNDPAKMRIGAALNLLIGGTPSIYYGQELGMKGISSFGKWGMTDANEIPVREAFEWYAADTGKGMALWYKNSGPWWDSTNVKSYDGISLEEEKADLNSLWHFYKKMISLHKSHETIASGTYQTIQNNSDSVVSFKRIKNNKAAIVVINLSMQEQHILLDMEENPNYSEKQLWGNDAFMQQNNKWQIKMPPYAINVWELEYKKTK